MKRSDRRPLLLRENTGGLTLIYKSNLFNQIPCTRKPVDDKYRITDIQTDVPAEIGVVHYVAHGTLPVAVEIDADKVSVSIQDRASRVAATGMV